MIRMSSRRTLAALFALPLLTLALASCGKESDKSAEAPKTEASKPAAPATPAAPSTPAKPGVAAPSPDATVDMAKLLQPGALPDMMMGKPDAPVTIVEYASMTCPHCAHFEVATLPDLKKKYIDTGKARLIFREFPFDPRAEAGFMLARCSADKYFPMVDVLYHQQEQWAGVKDSKAALLQIARLAGFSQESFEKCLTDQKLLDDIRAVRDRAEKDFSVQATPTFFINGKQYAGALSIDEMSAIIDGLL